MEANTYVTLTDRSILSVSGPDSFDFLQGLITQDLRKLETASDMIYSAFLTANGKFLHDFMVTKPEGDTYHLWVEKERRHDLIKRLQMYALRSDITLTDCTKDYQLFYSLENSISSFADPRGLKGFFTQVKAQEDKPEAFINEASLTTYHLFCLQQAVPNGSLTMAPKLADIQQFNLEDLNAISFDKGCFLGQEPVARIHYRGLLKQKAYALSCNTGLSMPAEDDNLLYDADGRKIGELCQIIDGHAYALLKIRFVTNDLVIFDSKKNQYQLLQI